MTYTRAFIFYTKCPCNAITSEGDFGKMNEVKIFSFKNNEIRSILIDDEPWFVGKDVAEVLGYSNTRDALSKHVENDDKNTVAIRDGIGNPNQTIINESGLYSLILSSKLPQAKEFKRWVTSVVLPEIRRTGSYNGLSNKDKFELAGLIAKCKNTKAVEALVALFEIDKPIKRECKTHNSVEKYLNHVGNSQLVELPTHEIYDEYKSYCKNHKIILLSLMNFSKEVRKITGAIVKRHRVNGKLTGFYVLG